MSLICPGHLSETRTWVTSYIRADFVFSNFRNMSTCQHTLAIPHVDMLSFSRDEAGWKLGQECDEYCPAKLFKPFCPLLLALAWIKISFLAACTSAVGSSKHHAFIFLFATSYNVEIVWFDISCGLVSRWQLSQLYGWSQFAELMVLCSLVDCIHFSICCWKHIHVLGSCFVCGKTLKSTESRVSCLPCRKSHTHYFLQHYLRLQCISSSRFLLWICFELKHKISWFTTIPEWHAYAYFASWAKILPV